MGFKLDSFIISLLVFSFIVTLGFGFVINMINTYEVEYDDEHVNFEKMQENYAIIDELYDDTLLQKDKVLGSETSIEEADVIESTVKGASSALRLLVSPIRVVNTLVQGEYGVASIIPAPPGVNYALYINTALMVVVIFGLIYLYFRIRSW